MAKTAGIVVIGNEILSGKTRDENASYLVRELRALGVDVRKISVIPDEVAPIRDEVRLFSRGFDYVFTSGGVGPTHDDKTMEGIAAAFGRSLYRNAELADLLRQYYQDNVSDAALRMANVPEGTCFLRGAGMWFPVVAVENVYVFPGVPEVLQRKFDRIKEMFRDAPFLLREIYLRVDEGEIAHALDRVMERFPMLLLGSYPVFTNPEYSVKLTVESKDPAYLDQAYLYLIEQLKEDSIVTVRAE